MLNDRQWMDVLQDGPYGLSQQQQTLLYHCNDPGAGSIAEMFNACGRVAPLVLMLRTGGAMWTKASSLETPIRLCGASGRSAALAALDGQATKRGTWCTPGRRKGSVRRRRT